MWGPKTGYTHALGASPLPNYFGCGACARKACAPHAFASFPAPVGSMGTHFFRIDARSLKSKKSMRSACFCAISGFEKQEKHAHSMLLCHVGCGEARKACAPHAFASFPAPESKKRLLCACLSCFSVQEMAQQHVEHLLVLLCVMLCSQSHPGHPRAILVFTYAGCLVNAERQMLREFEWSPPTLVTTLHSGPNF